MKPRVAVLISGGGSNMVTLVKAMQSGEIDVAVILQRPHIPEISEEIIVEETAAYIARNDHPKLKTLSTLDGLLSVDHLIVNLLGEANTWLDARLEELGKTRKHKTLRSSLQPT